MRITRKISFCLLVFTIQIAALLNASRVAAATVDICTSLCRCSNETGIEKIHCDFTDDKEYKLGDGLIFPLRANGINISLGDNTKLELNTGLFSSKNKINSLSIQGVKNDFKTSNNQVVLTQRSLAGISGVLPEISFKNIKRVTLREKSLDEAFEIVLFVESVWKVIVEKEVFGSTAYNATFNDIAELNLTDGFLITSVQERKILSLFINRCHISTLSPMRGTTLTELRIENSDIELIQSKAFSMIEIDSLVLNNVKIQSIESDIFREGALLQYLAVTNCIIGKIDKKAIHTVGVGAFAFEKNLVQDTIESDSIEFFGATVYIAHNTINKMGSNWLKASNAHNITIMNNTFGSFNSMILDGSSNLSCMFYHNKFTTVAQDSFKGITSRCPYRQLIFHENCSCKFSSYLKDRFDEAFVNVKDLEAESFCTLGNNDELMKCLNAETVKFEQYYDQKCSSSKKGRRLNCKKVKVDKIDAQFVDPKILSDDFDWMEYINYIIGGCIIIILLPCILCLVTRKKKSRRDENYNTSNNFHHNQHQTDLMHLNQSEGPPSYEASLRSTKSFSNHDRIIIKQTLDIMKQKQPEDKYEMVYNNTQRLLHEHLNEYEKVKIIGDIVQTIGECENCGEDFVAFTDILYKHLAPDTTTTLRSTTALNIQQQQQPPHIIDDLYSEPALPQTSDTAPRREYTKQNSEHIYAEPTMLTQQQTLMPLLLANNYSNPLDSNVVVNNNNVYSEPVIHDAAAVKTTPSLGTFKPIVATPYAISHTIDQPSTSTNLPDIVNRTEQPGPSGQQNPISRITRSPTTNRKIPEYTVPSTSHKVPVRITQDNIEDWSDESMENSTSSNHSGGSNATVKIDELLE